jgi:hypothetical protein
MFNIKRLSLILNKNKLYATLKKIKAINIAFIIILYK